MLTPKRREALFTRISEVAVAFGMGRAEVEEVDRLNVYWAAMEARRRAVEALPTTPAHVLVDGAPSFHIPCPCDSRIRGLGKVAPTLA